MSDCKNCAEYGFPCLNCEDEKLPCEMCGMLNTKDSLIWSKCKKCYRKTRCVEIKTGIFIWILISFLITCINLIV